MVVGRDKTERMASLCKKRYGVTQNAAEKQDSNETARELTHGSGEKLGEKKDFDRVRDRGGENNGFLSPILNARLFSCFITIWFWRTFPEGGNFAIALAILLELQCIVEK